MSMNPTSTPTPPPTTDTTPKGGTSTGTGPSVTDAFEKVLQQLNDKFSKGTSGTSGGTGADGISIPSIQTNMEMQVESGMLYAGQSSQSPLDISNPQVPGTHSEVIADYVTNGLTPSTTGSTSTSIDDLEKLTNALASGAPAAQIAKSLASGDMEGVRQGVKACLLMGGLVQVSLEEIMSNFAHINSIMKKMSSNLFLETQADIMDLAKAIAKVIVEEADTQAAAKIAQAVVSAVSAGVQLKFSMDSLKGFEDRPAFKTDENGQEVRDPLTGDKIPLYHAREGDKIQAKDDNGKPLFETRFKTKLQDKVGENGQPVYKTKKDDHGNDLTDWEHNVVYEKDPQGNKIPEQEPVRTGEKEEVPVYEVDENGRPKTHDQDIPMMRAATTAESNKAQQMGQLSQIASAIGQAVNNMVDAYSTYETGQFEADKEILNTLKDQMGKYQDSFKGIESDANQRVDQALDLLKTMLSNLMQAFRSLTGK